MWFLSFYLGGLHLSVESKLLCVIRETYKIRKGAFLHQYFGNNYSVKTCTFELFLEFFIDTSNLASLLNLFVKCVKNSCLSYFCALFCTSLVGLQVHTGAAKPAMIQIRDSRIFTEFTLSFRIV